MLTIGFGMGLMPWVEVSGWLVAKLGLVTLLVLMHLWLGVHLYALGRGRRARGAFLLPGVLGWAPLVLLLAIAALTGAKPRSVGDLPPPGTAAATDSAHSSSASSSSAEGSERAR